MPIKTQDKKWVGCDFRRTQYELWLCFERQDCTLWEQKGLWWKIRGFVPADSLSWWFTSAAFVPLYGCRRLGEIFLSFLLQWSSTLLPQNLHSVANWIMQSKHQICTQTVRCVSWTLVHSWPKSTTSTLTLACIAVYSGIRFLHIQCWWIRHLRICISG